MPDPLTAARRLADDLLAPAAAEADARGTLPPGHFDALAEAGLYALGADGEPLGEVCAVAETLTAGCAATAFVWMQHVGALTAVAHREPDALRDAWLEPLRRGERRAGAAFTGAALPGPASLRATRVDGGWRFDGVTPWITGWGHVDVLRTAARDPEDRVVWALVDAREEGGLTVERLRLLGLDASATVRARFDGVLVEDARVLEIAPPPEPPGLAPGTARVHAALSLGVAARCCAAIGPSPLDAELAAVREAADAALEDPAGAAIVEARAASAELAIRAAAALMTVEGARAVVAGGLAERSAREALVLSVFGLRAPIRAALRTRLGASL
ncbi:MAG: acyl-CoA/acyl-ACP dehydrogenase [Solirubrobacteraceae bacterium]|nr:acyl-CoA/acyl-ACP dehydrogenase [Solirubrobacteraceae bacterium]